MCPSNDTPYNKQSVGRLSNTVSSDVTACCPVEIGRMEVTQKRR